MMDWMREWKRPTLGLAVWLAGCAMEAPEAPEAQAERGLCGVGDALPLGEVVRGAAGDRWVIDAEEDAALAVSVRGASVRLYDETCRELGSTSGSETFEVGAGRRLLVVEGKPGTPYGLYVEDVGWSGVRCEPGSLHPDDGGDGVVVSDPGDQLALGSLLQDRPTLQSLGVFWGVAGDANRDAAVSMSVRTRGGDAVPAMDLFRLQGEIMSPATNSRWEAPNAFAGSALELVDDTAYELRLEVTDPDGIVRPDGRVVSSVVCTARQATRGVPVRSAGREHHVYPAGWTGPRTAPDYDTLGAAYLAARGGEQILLHAGVHTAPDDGWVLDRWMRRPLTIRGAGDGEAILDGAGVDTVLDLRGAAGHRFHDLTVRGGQTLGMLGDATAGSHDLAFTEVHFDSRTDTVYDVNQQHWGVLCNTEACTDLYFADCVFEGPKDTWATPTAPYSTGLRLAGRGHVISYSRFSGFRDGVSLFRSTAFPARATDRTSAVDIHHNEVFGCDDDGVQLDFGFHNIRFMHNFVHRSMMGVSFQPVYGGPAYVYRNVLYNLSRQAFKPNGWPSGLLILHNTVAPSRSAASFSALWQNSWWLNNRFVGTDAGDKIIGHGTPLPARARMDHNGYFLHQTATPWQVTWTQYEPPAVSNGNLVLDRQPAYPSLSAFATAEGFEVHGVDDLSPSDFLAYILPNGTESDDGTGLDLRLAPGAQGVDEGLVLHGINDRYDGTAPDLGAYELGDAPVHYGPRP